MLKVIIEVNGHEIFSESAVNISGDGCEYCRYRMSDGRIIKHRYSQGAKSLAVKLLRHSSKEAKFKGLSFKRMMELIASAKQETQHESK